MRNESRYLVELFSVTLFKKEPVLLEQIFLELVERKSKFHFKAQLINCSVLLKLQTSTHTLTSLNKYNSKQPSIAESEERNLV